MTWVWYPPVGGGIARCRRKRGYIFFKRFGGFETSGGEWIAMAQMYELSAFDRCWLTVEEVS